MSQYDKIDSIETPDDHTVVVKYKSFNVVFTDQFPSIIPRTATGDVKDMPELGFQPRSGRNWTVQIQGMGFRRPYHSGERVLQLPRRWQALPRRYQFPRRSRPRSRVHAQMLQGDAQSHDLARRDVRGRSSTNTDVVSKVRPRARYLDGPPSTSTSPSRLTTIQGQRHRTRLFGDVEGA